MIKGECVLTALRVLKLTELVCSLRNKLFHNKFVPHNHKMEIPQEVEDSYVCCHIFSVHKIVPLTWISMILNNRNILNYVTPLNASNCTTW